MSTYIHLPEVSGIYQIVNNTTEKRYVGYASNIRQRLKGHVSDLSLKKHANNYLQKAWDKHGQNDFTFLVIEECCKEALCLKEDYWVKILKTTNEYYGYNIKPTDPEGKAGQSLETIEKLKIANKGKTPSALCLQRRKETQTSKEGRERQIASLKKVDWYKVREHKRKKVINIVTGEIYDSLKTAAKIYNIPTSRLSKYLVGTRTNKTNLKYL
jgi:group I intron endonuclease